ncbi:MAG: flagellar hook-length control protein FliK [Alphaproteobacteria bacterium]|nr:flagellar hook-length control protein FliK [Alphaproteobacteria bacterium]
METSTIDAAGQAATSGSKSRKTATEIFGSVLAKFLDRIGTTMDGPDDVGEAFFQSKPQATERSTPPDRTDETPPADRRETSDKPRDELPPLIAAAFVAPRDDTSERPAAATAEAAASDDKFHPDATAAPRSPSTTAEPGAAARVPTPPQAKDPAAAPVPVPPVPFAGGGNATNAPPPQVQVTVASAAVQAQATAPLAAGSTLALQEQGSDAPKPTLAAGGANSLAASSATPGNGGASGGGDANADAGANGNLGQPGFGTMPAGIALPAAALAQAAGSAASPTPFAATVEQVAADGADATLAPVLPANALASAEAAAGAKRAAALPAAPPLPRLAAMEQIAINVRKAVAAGLDEVTIQLRPDELGRIDVRMEVGKDGQVSAHIRADKPETLDLLQRDARGLERVLQDAGLRADSNSLSFGLRGDNGAQGQGSGRPQQGVVAETPEETAAPLPVITRAADGRVDLHV